MTKDPYAYRPRKSPLESSVQKSTITHARSLGLFCTKFSSPMSNSVPDFLLWFPGGHVLAIEFKQLGKKPTDLQEQTIAKMRKLGFDVEVIDNAKDGKALIDDRMGRFSKGAEKVVPAAAASSRPKKNVARSVRSIVDRARRR